MLTRLFSFLLVSCWAAVFAVAEEPVHVSLGVLMHLSDTYNPDGILQRTAMEVTCEWINAGTVSGVDDVTVDMTFVDTGFSNQSSLVIFEAFRLLASTSPVDGIIGCSSSSPTVHVAPITEAYSRSMVQT